MSCHEIDTFVARQVLFMERGASSQDVERMADKLVLQDREVDDRRLCLECRHFPDHGPYCCGNALAAGLLPDLLQRCHGHDDAHLPVNAAVGT